MPNNDNQRKIYWIPMPIDEDTRIGFGIRAEEVHYYLIGDHVRNVFFVETDDEAIYRGCMKILWADAKAEERERLPFEYDSNRRLKKVYHKVSGKDVDSYIPGRPLSLDVMIANNSFRVAVNNDPSLIVERRMRNEALLEAAKKDGPTAAIIAKLLLKDTQCPEKVLMEATRINAQTSLNYQKNRTKEIIKEEFEKWL